MKCNDFQSIFHLSSFAVYRRNVKRTDNIKSFILLTWVRFTCIFPSHTFIVKYHWEYYSIKISLSWSHNYEPFLILFYFIRFTFSYFLLFATQQQFLPYANSLFKQNIIAVIPIILEPISKHCFFLAKSPRCFVLLLRAFPFFYSTFSFSLSRFFFFFSLAVSLFLWATFFHGVILTMQLLLVLFFWDREIVHNRLNKGPVVRIHVFWAQCKTWAKNFNMFIKYLCGCVFRYSRYWLYSIFGQCVLNMHFSF